MNIWFKSKYILWYSCTCNFYFRPVSKRSRLSIFQCCQKSLKSRTIGQKYWHGISLWNIYKCSLQWMSIYRLNIVYLCKQCLFHRKFQSQFESFSELKATDKTISPKGTLLYNTESVWHCKNEYDGSRGHMEILMK